MDLYAYMLTEESPLVKKYITDCYGPIPRFRGARIMRYEEPSSCPDDTLQGEIWREYCGKDIVYIHTRCGGNNYEPCGGKEWEKSHVDFLQGVDDAFDETYRDSYFLAVQNDDYNRICESIEKGEI